MQTSTILFSFVGLFSAAPQYYQPYILPISYQKYLEGYGGVDYTSIASSAIKSKPYSFDFSFDDDLDVITQTRRLSNALHNTLTEVAADPNSALIVDTIIRDNYSSCITGLEEGIASIETARGQMERVGSEVRALVTKLKAFVDLSQPEEFVRNAAEILRLLGPLVTHIGPVSPITCQAGGSDQPFGSLTSLAELLGELSQTQEITLSQAGRGQLKQSASIISAVTSFLTQLRSTLSRFENICTADKEDTLDYINAMGDIMVNLADLLNSLSGSALTGENLRKGKAFVAQITVSKPSSSNNLIYLYEITFSTG